MLLSNLKRRGACVSLVTLAFAFFSFADPTNTRERIIQKNLLPGEIAHFILLLDDSRYMDTHRDLIKRNLPSLLFRAEVRDLAEGISCFRPGIDRLSLIFFTLRGGDGSEPGCEQEARLSVDPDHLFQPAWSPGHIISGKDEFAKLLNEQIDLNCRFKGDFSPIAAAEMLVLPFIQRRLPETQLFSKTVIINITDGRGNLQTLPACELEALRVGVMIRNNLRIVENIDGAIRLVRDVSDAFYLTGSTIQLYPGSDVVISRVSQVNPSGRLPEFMLSFRDDVQLDRVATGRDTLHIVPTVEGSTDLRIKVDRLQPIHLFYRFHDGNGGPWKIGKTTLPASEKSIDLLTCSPPLCTKEKDWITVSLLKLEDRFRLSSDDADLTAGALSFRVGFLFRNKYYDRLYRESEPQTIKFTPVEPVVIKRSVLLPSVRLGNEELAGLWTESDRIEHPAGLTQREATSRITAQRAKMELILVAAIVIAIVIAALTILLYFYKTAYHRRFRPEIKWQADPSVIIDFNQPAAGRLLAGTLEITNPEKVPWFGRLLGNKEQPACLAHFKFNPTPLEEYGIVLRANDKAAIGFLQGAYAGGPEDRSDESFYEAPQLELEARETITQGRRILIFIAPEAILDYNGGQSPTDDLILEVPLSVEMIWNYASGKAGGHIKIDRSAVHLRIKPEEPKAPLITYDGGIARDLFFARGEEINVGTYVFHSASQHSFACPFVGRYELVAASGNAELPDGALRLARSNIFLKPGDKISVPVLLRCDGEVVANPGAQSTEYEFTIKGNKFDPSSETGPHRFRLYRDRSRSEIDLKINYYNSGREFFWGDDGFVRQREVYPSGEPGAASMLEGGGKNKYTFRPHFPIKIYEDQRPVNLITIQVGNSAKSGEGYVSLRAVANLRVESGYESRIILWPGRYADEIIGVYRFDERLGGEISAEPHFFVKDGDQPQRCDIRFDPRIIERIQGVSIPSDKCFADVSLEISVRDDEGNERKHDLLFAVPIELEQLAGPNWLCIDFGTSAIAVARGVIGSDEVDMINLQKIPILENGLSFAEEDTENVEKGTPFLPSWIVCDADLRSGPPGPEFRGRPAGFSQYRPATRRPGDASFVGLPALIDDVDRNPRRVIFSIKSWLGTSSRVIRLPERIRFLSNGGEIEDNELPLDEVVESCFSALAEAYLRQDKTIKADQIIICHPNTFTLRHKERLHAIACRAMMKHLGIAYERHIHVISESDAVAYYYCMQRMKEGEVSGQERVLVYDFGAGTLDLSIIKFSWNEAGAYPEKWDIEGQIGVPVAGNYIDEMLARSIHELLLDGRVLASAGLDYHYRLINKQACEVDKDYRKAVIAFWAALREAKHRWEGGDESFEVKVGEMNNPGGLVRYDGKGTVARSRPGPGATGVWGDGNNILLTISAEKLRSTPRMTAFHEFVTKTVPGIVMKKAGICETRTIDKLIFSGRGSLWPGLREKVQEVVQARVPDYFKDQILMKEAVVRGAITYQSLLRKSGQEAPGELPVRLGVRLTNGKIVPIKSEDQPIDLTLSPVFQLVQCGVEGPLTQYDPKSLMRYLFVPLSHHSYRRDTLWNDSPNLYVSVTRNNGRLHVLLKNQLGQAIPAFSDEGTTTIINSPPWPIGQILLDPEDD